jgi:hypothetical protein
MNLMQKNYERVNIWCGTTIDLIEKILKKDETDISDIDLEQIYNKLQVMTDVLSGKSKIIGWRIQNKE